MKVAYLMIASSLVFSRLPSTEGYDSDFTDLVELVYGEGYLSQGGSSIIAKMFQGMSLDESSVLDVGCGVGGPALALAKTYTASVTGTDPEPFMIAKCHAALAKSPSLKGSVTFTLMENPLTLQQFASESFDVVTSKESILHVPNEHKLSYFKELYRVLKPGGVILDWQHTTPNYSARVKEMMEMDGVPFHLTTPDEYHHIVSQAGFSHVMIEDMTEEFAKHSKQDVAIIESNQDQITQRFGKETYSYARQSWAMQGEAFLNRELLVGIIKAVKP